MQRGSTLVVNALGTFQYFCVCRACAILHKHDHKEDW